MKHKINVQVSIHASLEQVWELWTNPKHICQWNFANDDWHTPKASNELQVGGRFVYRMEAKDGSFGFDFSGKYTQVITHETIQYTLDDERKVEIYFSEKEKQITVSEYFEPENENSEELQKQGWQLILNNFKKYAESQANA